MVGHVEDTTKPAQEPVNAAAETAQLIFTISTANGEIVNVEKMDSTGTRGSLSEEECRQIAGDEDADDFESALDAGFEAGIHEALGDDDLLERLVLYRLLVSGRSSDGLRALRRRALRRFLLARLLQRHASQQGETKA